jgi:hypothetical protein
MSLMHRATNAVVTQRAVCLALLAMGGLAATVSARAELYKWADDQGVTHYSSVAPDTPKAKVKRIDNKDLAVAQATAPVRDTESKVETPPIQALATKVDELQRQVDAEHQARVTADAQNAATQAAYAQALASQQAARAAYVPTIPTVSGVIFLPEPRRHLDDPCRFSAAAMGCSHAEHRRQGDHAAPHGQLNAKGG